MGTDYQKGGRVKSLQSRLLLRYRAMVLQSTCLFLFFIVYFVSSCDFIIQTLAYFYFLFFQLRWSTILLNSLYRLNKFLDNIEIKH